MCGDSHTATHGAFGALAFGIGTSEVEHVLATQTIIQKKAKNMRIKVDGKLAEGVTSKDIILHIIGHIGTAGGTGCALEYCGTAIEALSMEARMSIVSSTFGYFFRHFADNAALTVQHVHRSWCPSGHDRTR